MRHPVRPNPEKLRELVLLISQLSRNDPFFGAVKLNKLLFFADFLAYLRLGQAITGHEYQKLPQGPAPRAIAPLLNEMKRDGALEIQIAELHGLQQFRTVPLREPLLGQFSKAELDLVSDLVKKFWSFRAVKISAYSHLFTAYQVAEFNETIPYESALVGTMEPTESVINRGRELDAKAKRFLTRGRT